MSAAVAPRTRSIESRRMSGVAAEAPLVRYALTALALAFLTAFLLVPLGLVFAAAFAKGLSGYLDAIRQDAALSAIRLTFFIAAIVVPLNLVFGIAVAWLLAKYEFRGKNVLATVLDLPFSVSPVIAGLVFVLLFGVRGWLGPWFVQHGMRIIFAVPGMVLATLFVNLPLIAREVHAVMDAQGSAEEEAALTLGASGWQILRRITLPKIRWGLLYGIVLCNARAMGEFGAVSVVSGHIGGQTNTMTLHVEILYNDYDFVGAFAVASLLTLVALVTLVLKSAVGRFSR